MSEMNGKSTDNVGHMCVNEMSNGLINNNNDAEIISLVNDKSNDTITEDEDNSGVCLEEINIQQQKLLKEKDEKIKLLEDKCIQIESKLKLALKQKENAIKEKENMVVKYAMGEKNFLDQKQQKEVAEKKLKEIVRENEILQHKVQVMGTEKARICQMLDNKTYEHRSLQQELDKCKAESNALESKLKWTQNSLKTEIELHKESQARIDHLNSKLQETCEQIQQVKTEAQDSIKNFKTSQENRAHVLDQQLKEQQATLILLRHEKEEKEVQCKNLNQELERLQNKQKEMLQENNNLSLRVQQLERDRLENEQKLSELRACADQQRQDAADLLGKSAQLEQMKLQLKNEQDQLQVCNEQMNLLKQRNTELESDMESCRIKEAELLLFTQQLTDKNVRLQSEFTAMETKVQQLTCEHTLLKRTIKENETKATLLSRQLQEESTKLKEKNESLSKELVEKSVLCDKLKQEVADAKGENLVIKRKMELSLREVNKELHNCRKRLEQYESLSNTSSSSSDTSLNKCNDYQQNGSQVKVIQPNNILDRETLIEHIAKLQRISAKKSEKIDFLEEHVNTLVSELQKKTRLLQSYILRDQSGTLTSTTMDNNKAALAKLNGVMASVYSSRVADRNLTLELSLDINHKLQAVLEDALLKNITLKENVDTLGEEIDRLNKLLKS